ncbi:AlpA family transcriptional regulator [Methylosinus sp. KRF6]|uniref:helix-turn-helix transcriptional regulator n=1 Tax=Methylosinus sp. KRF6 TaxID=2846853 RepID=UPI001C0DCDA4|nr:helix-turn-helix domain-containing protein [Methylosinus sp. KRF6]MBU3887589.1 helix-turn-helix domain-containing protein [Methylosinus sp. KRF6]
MVNKAENANQNKAVAESATGPFPTDKATSIKELRTFIGVSHGHIFKMMRNGELPPSIKLGARRVFDPIDLNAWWAARKSVA